ncbi:MAG: hypothetical protein M0036_03245 [Desulfobacteraceae bacterium]|nr:hypothetical protein [Desulfobacteraceae bacterium]
MLFAIISIKNNFASIGTSHALRIPFALIEKESRASAIRGSIPPHKKESKPFKAHIPAELSSFSNVSQRKSSITLGRFVSTNRLDLLNQCYSKGEEEN